MASTHSPDGGADHPTGSEEDRVVSRRVDNPTAATEDDERAYAASSPDPVGDQEPNRPAPDGAGTTERAERDLRTETAEPTRSE